LCSSATYRRAQSLNAGIGSTASGFHGRTAQATAIRRRQASCHPSAPLRSSRTARVSRTKSPRGLSCARRSQTHSQNCRLAAKSVPVAARANACNRFRWNVDGPASCSLAPTSSCENATRVMASWDGHAEDLAFRLSKFTRFSVQPAMARATMNAPFRMCSPESDEKWCFKPYVVPPGRSETRMEMQPPSSSGRFNHSTALPIVASMPSSSNSG